MVDRSDDVDRPVALSVDVATQAWLTRAGQPEMICAAAWSEACKAWWNDPSDDRLRRRVLDTLSILESDLGNWLSMPLDEAGLIRAHRHVIATRAGLERGGTSRILATGSLRSVPVISHHRSGRLIRFAEPDEMRGYVRTLAEAVQRLPQHPFMRAGWISDTLGAIHAFTDGNGGTARFLSSLALARWWLPPLTLSQVQRNSSYIEAIVTHDHHALEHVIYESVQTELARVLLSETGPPAVWDHASRARANRWIDRTDQAWGAAAGGPSVRDEPGAAGLVRMARRGYRLPRSPLPVCTRWTPRVAVPVQFELAIAPVFGGATPWMVAVIGASLGHDGTLGILLHREPIVAIFVAVNAEDDDLVDARFERWLAARVDQSLRGLAAWM
ncbi:MAG: Fic family protein [Kofleriaceae bacterium]